MAGQRVQFRFRNWGALAGNVDLWHLDYILLDDQIDPLTFEVQSEVAIVEPVNTFLREYTRMPWNHFTANPAFYMRDSLVMEQRNLSTTQADNIESGFSIAFNGAAATYPSPFQNTNVLPEARYNPDLPATTRKGRILSSIRRRAIPRRCLTWPSGKVPLACSTRRKWGPGQRQHHVPAGFRH